MKAKRNYSILNHLCKNCAIVAEKYNVLPVIVFEQSEILKFRKIKKYLKKKKLVVFPKLLLNQNSKVFSMFKLWNSEIKFKFYYKVRY